MICEFCGKPNPPTHRTMDIVSTLVPPMLYPPMELILAYAVIAQAFHATIPDPLPEYLCRNCFVLLKLIVWSEIFKQGSVSFF